MEYLREKKCAPWQSPGRNVLVNDSVRANGGVSVRRFSIDKVLFITLFRGQAGSLRQIT